MLKRPSAIAFGEGPERKKEANVDAIDPSLWRTPTLPLFPFFFLVLSIFVHCQCDVLLMLLLPCQDHRRPPRPISAKTQDSALARGGEMGQKRNLPGMLEKEIYTLQLQLEGARGFIEITK